MELYKNSKKQTIDFIRIGGDFSLLNCRNFTYCGESSEDYNVFLAFVGDPGTVTDALYTADIVEERIPSQITPIFFGLDRNKAISRELTICSDKYLSREEIDSIFKWLTCSTPGYGKFSIEDDDELSEYEYRVIFQNLELINSGWPFAISCTAIFDSQWAYQPNFQNSYEVSNGKVITPTGVSLDNITIENSSSYLGYIYPKIVLQIDQGVTSFAITNETDRSRTLEFNFPGSFTTKDGSDKMIIEIDNRTKIMQSNCTDINPYKCLPNKDGYFYFFRLLKGDNVISFSGSGLCTIKYDILKGVGL